MALTDDDIAQILKLIDATPFDEIDIEWKGVKIQLRRGGGIPASIRPRQDEKTSIKANEPKAAVASPAVEPAQPVRKNAPQDAPLPSGVVAVRAQTMGTFYRCPEPGAAPFVQQGAKVAEGDTLCLIEVMKVFSAVSAERAGTVENICVEDGSLVEFDQTLFHMRSHDA